MMMSQIDIERLSPKERLDLIERLWDSLDADAIPLTPAQIVELDRRLATADADLADSVPWETVRTELMARHR
jgi:putative addiction module component (TIGR02574 family)